MQIFKISQNSDKLNYLESLRTTIVNSIIICQSKYVESVNSESKSLFVLFVGQELTVCGLSVLSVGEIYNVCCLSVLYVRSIS